MPNLLLDAGGKPAPQYKRVDGTAYEELRGTSGAMHTAPQSLPSIPAGDNNIGNVDIVTMPALPAGSNNIGDVDIASMPALPAGTNRIGKVQIESLADAIKYAATVNAGSDTTIWTPGSGKSIMLKGIRLQNTTNAVGSVAAGLGSPDAVVDIKADTVVISKVKLQGHHFLSDTIDKIYFTGGAYEAQVISFGEGLKLAADAVLKVLSDVADVTVSAWGYEV